jgi:sugar phosphate isomerase/epimerase
MRMLTRESAIRNGLTRRTFIEQAACASAVLASVRRASAQSGMFLSLNGSLTRQMPWPDFVRLAGKVGYPGVDVQLAAARKDGVEATRALFKEARVRPGVTNLPVQFAAADEAAYQTGLAQLEENAKFAAEIGCTRMMAVLSPASNEPRDERRKFIIARLTPIAGILQKSGIRLGLEFLGPLMFRTRGKEPFIWTLPETVALAKEIGPNIGATLDAWHWHHSGGTTADILATDRSRIVHIHVSDAKPQPPEEVRDNQRHMPGEGVIDLVGFFQALKKVGYQDAVSPEPLGRVPEDMTPEDGARLGLETTLAVMKKAGVS